MKRVIKNERTAVYVISNRWGDDKIIYVGISVNPHKRFSAHVTERKFTREEHVMHTHSWHSRRKDAAKKERELIAELMPEKNKMSKPGFYTRGMKWDKALAKKMLLDGKSVLDVAEACGVHRNTIDYFKSHRMNEEY